MIAKILGHLKSINFPFGTNGKLMVFDVPILKHFRILSFQLMNNVKLEADGKCTNKAYISKVDTKVSTAVHVLD